MSEETVKKLAYLASQGTVTITKDVGINDPIFDVELTVGDDIIFEAEGSTISAAVSGVYVQIGESLRARGEVVARAIGDFEAAK